MSSVNKQMDLPTLQKTMMNFEKETTKMDMAGELSEWKCVYLIIRMRLHSNLLPMLNTIRVWDIETAENHRFLV